MKTGRKKKAERFLGEVKKSKDCRLDAFIYALGIPNVGKRTARDLAERFKSFEALAGADMQTLTEIDEIGDIVAGSIIEFLGDEINAQMVDRLFEAGVSPEYQASSEKSEGFFAGKTFVLTGHAFKHGAQGGRRTDRGPGRKSRRLCEQEYFRGYSR